MAAEALLQSVPLLAVDPAAVDQYQRYLKAQLLHHSRLLAYNPQNDAVCDTPFCLQPRGAHSPWMQCDVISGSVRPWVPQLLWQSFAVCILGGLLRV